MMVIKWQKLISSIFVFAQTVFTLRVHSDKCHPFCIFFKNNHPQGSFRECLLNSLDIFTFVVNPMLPPGESLKNLFYSIFKLKI